MKTLLNKQISDHSLYFIGYVIASLCLGFLWYRAYILINSDFFSHPILKFTFRFIFGLLYYFLAYTYCILTEQHQLKKYLTQLYFFFESTVFISGLIRFTVLDSPTLLAIYRTFLKATVSPLGFIMAYVYHAYIRSDKTSLLNLKNNNIS